MKHLFSAVALSLSLSSLVHAEVTPAPVAEQAVLQLREAKMKAAGYFAMPMQAVGNHYTLDVSIGGKKVSFLVDTGAMYSMLRADKVDQLELETQKIDVDAVGVGGITKMDTMAKAKSLVCGNGVPVNISFYVMDVEKWPRAYAGLLGTDFLKSQKAIFDYEQSVLWVKSKDAPQDVQPNFSDTFKAQGFTELKVTEKDNHLFVKALVGDKEARFVVDSGAMISMFREAAVKQFPFDQVIKGSAVISGVSGRMNVSALAKTKKLKIADLPLQAHDFYVVDLSVWPESYVSQLDGVLGSDFLKAQNTLVDYVNGSLWVRK